MSPKSVTIRTWIERDQRGWYCYVGFWVDTPVIGDAEADDWLRVGPFESHEIANAHLRGPFRDLVRQGIEGWFGAEAKVNVMPPLGWPESS